MSHNTRTRDDLAAWGSGAVSPTEFENLDANAYKSINGDDGGVWAPSSQIEIGGSGILMSGPFVADGTSTFNGQVTFASGSAPIFNDGPVFNNTATFNANVNIGNAFTDILNVIATANFDNDVTIGASLVDLMTVLGESDFSGAAFFHGDVRIGVGTGEELQIDADVEINGNTVVVGNIELAGGIDITGLVELDDELNFGASSLITGIPTLGSYMRFSGPGRVPLRVAELTNASQTVAVADGNFFLMAPLTADKTIIIGDSGAVSGDFMFIENSSSGGSAADIVVDLPSNPSVTIAHSGAKCRLFVRGSTTWFHADFS